MPSKTRDSPYPVSAPHNLPYRMRLLVQLMGRTFRNVLDPYDVTPLHWGVLCRLWEQDGLATQDLAAQLGQLGGTLTVGLDAMEKRQLIRREQDAEDRRIYRVWLLKRGKELERELFPDVAALTAQMFACLSKDEYRNLTDLIERLHKHLEDTQTS